MPTLACNAACEYCFQNKTGSRMSDEVLNRFLDGLLEYSRQENIRGIKIFWQGGDVLTLPPERASEILDIIRERTAGMGITVNHHIQTNLLGYHGGWTRILKDNFRDRISSSLDYPNLYRRAPGIGVDDYFGRWLQKKNEIERDGFGVSVIALPNAETLERGAGAFYDFFRNTAGVRSLQVNFPFPGIGSDYPRQLSLRKYADFLRDLYRVWVADGKRIYLRPFTTIERKKKNPQASTFCIWSYCCADDILAVAPGGEVAQCDCWILCLDEFQYGTVRDAGLRQLLASPNREIFYRRTEQLALQGECGQCDYWRLCHGGCPIRAYRFSGNFFQKDHFCSVYRALFDTVS
jgi:radical SAM protein with 4Fe4S-binding SPASM domain